ncbi:phage tail protein [Pseudoalteromonas denitrificans]|uniref:P2-related tail formation protein n=1 Tax=Pseudoalteromonas denitrificans DSM 6059 TaxID=1123010 RepID=A0A1I1PW96_9GAMM|nr:phage tail protein [Pseudoalteromonas denitrificans]SFD14126.1 P2-related tail formation protein [Pseudoalteromonas denitrificans DSM 6059]
MTVLPPSAKPLVHTLENINQMPLQIDDAIGQLHTLKSEPSDNLLHWLVWEYGLEAILPYSHDLKKVLKDGLSWQRIRGTPQSLNLALGWIDLTQVGIEAEPPGRHFYEYQLATGKIPGDKDVSRILNLAKLSAPTRSKLARLYHHYDIRKLNLSQGEFGQFLSDYSGTYFYDGEFTASKVSFAQDHKTHVHYGQNAFDVLNINAVKNNVVKNNAVKDNAVKDNAVKDNAVKNNAIKHNQVQSSQNQSHKNEVKTNIFHTRHYSLSSAYLNKQILGQFVLGERLNTGFTTRIASRRHYTVAKLLGSTTWFAGWGNVSWADARYGVIAIKNSPYRQIDFSALQAGVLQVETQLQGSIAEPLTPSDTLSSLYKAGNLQLKATIEGGIAAPLPIDDIQLNTLRAGHLQIQNDIEGQIAEPALIGDIESNMHQAGALQFKAKIVGK